MINPALLKKLYQFRCQKSLKIPNPWTFKLRAYDLEISNHTFSSIIPSWSLVWYPVMSLDSLSVLAEYHFEFSLPTMTKTRGCQSEVSVLYYFLFYMFKPVYILRKSSRILTVILFMSFVVFMSVLCKTLVQCPLWPLQSQCCKPDKILLNRSKATHDNSSSVAYQSRLYLSVTFFCHLIHNYDTGNPHT